MNDSDRDLADAAAELSETLEALRAELREPTRGPFGLPRPPSPSKLLRFTERHTIPTVIVFLEASIRTLELLAAALRVADGRPLNAALGRLDRRGETDPFDPVDRIGRDRIARTSRETLRRLDDALADLQSAAAGEPPNPEIRRLLEEARELRADVDNRLAAATSVSTPETTGGTDGRHGPVEIGVSAADEGSGAPQKDDADRVGIDVDEELASIKDDLEAERSSSSGNDDDGEENNDDAPSEPGGNDRPDA